MSLEVWYPQDVINILAALSSAGELQGPEYHKALNDVALAFGVKSPTVGLLETPIYNYSDKPWRIVDAEAVTISNISRKD